MLLELASVPSDISEQSRHTIEWFILLDCDRTSSCTDVDKAREKMQHMIQIQKGWTSMHISLQIPKDVQLLEEKLVFHS